MACDRYVNMEAGIQAVIYAYKNYLVVERTNKKMREADTWMLRNRELCKSVATD